MTETEKTATQVKYLEWLERYLAVEIRETSNALSEHMQQLSKVEGELRELKGKEGS